MYLLSPSLCQVKFGNGEWLVGKVQYERKYSLPLPIIIPAVVVPMLLIIAISVVCYRFEIKKNEQTCADHLDESLIASDHLCAGGRVSKRRENMRK